MATDQSGSRQQDMLIRLGAILFLLGLLSGLITGIMANPRMGLSAHLEGVLNGVFLLAIGALWPRVILGPLTKTVACWSLVIGTSLNWLVVQLGAFWGTGAMTPLAAPGFEAAPWQEMIVTAGLIGVTIGMLTGALLIVIGLMRRAS